MSVTETGTRAREPDEQGFATTPDGLRLHWEVHGTNTPTIVLLPPCPISHSRLWKAQVHHLARHHRVVVYDGRGNGNSDSPDPSGIWRNAWWPDDCRPSWRQRGRPRPCSWASAATGCGPRCGSPRTTRSGCS